MTRSSPIRTAVRHAALCALAVPLLLGAAPADAYRAQRERMVEIIRREAAATGSETGRPALSKGVIEAMRRVPRHEFVPRAQRHAAYENHPLPIGYGQTISQPYIVALMTELLDLEQGDVVFELGTGSGYQAAVLSRLAGQVYTVEIVEPLGKLAAERFARLGYDNVNARVGDGYDGWPDAAPFDAIIVTAAADHIPPPLVRQLKPGGRMIIPVGGPFMVQHLTLVEKSPAGQVSTRQILPVRFVPVTRKR